VAGPENNLDEILFDWNTKNQKSFTFKFSKDTLNIYETREDADSINLIVDKLKYKLVKHK
jgi:6-phosphogluconate dehydrogenase